MPKRDGVSRQTVYKDAFQRARSKAIRLWIIERDFNGQLRVMQDYSGEQLRELVQPHSCPLRSCSDALYARVNAL
jgi:hypothetical protein